MGKFSLECPHCGTINTASTSLFAKKEIICNNCKALIDVRSTRMNVKTCTQCGATFAFDQAKAKDRKCPSCGEPVTLSAKGAMTHYISVDCPQCGCIVDVDKDTTNPICPVCNHGFNMKAVLAKQKLVTDANLSVIKYEGDNNTLVWKHPIEDFNSGSQLLVHESQEAVFFYNGEALDSFGPGRHTLDTENLPLLKAIYKLPTGKQSPFHAEVYFVNKTDHLGIKWGTDSRVRFIDPETGIPLDIGAFGELSLRVKDGRKLLIKLIGTTGGLENSKIITGVDYSGNANGFGLSHASIQGYFRAPLLMQVKSYLASTIKSLSLNILEIDEHLVELSAALLEKIAPSFEEYGLTIPNFYVNSISLPDSNEFKRLQELRSRSYLDVREQEVLTDIAAAEQKRKLVEAQTEAQKKIIEAEATAAAMKATGFAAADVMTAQGVSKKDFLQADVQKEYARGLGNMGGGSGGSGIVGDVLGLGVGLSAVEQMKSQIGDSLFATASKEQPATGWECSCGEKGIAKNFCPNCGKAKPESWDCECGEKGITKNFCPNCGKAKPATWDCECGEKGIAKNFCPNCGRTKPATWDCECGEKGIAKNFCPNCGRAKPASEATWDCECGEKGIAKNFCPNCGRAKPTGGATWDCECGEKGITKNFCPNCGKSKE